MKDIIEMVKYFEDSGLILKGVSEIIQNEAKEQNRGFLSILAGKGVIATSQWRAVNRAGEGTIAKRQDRGIVRAGYGIKKVQKTTAKNKYGFLMPPHPLANFEIQKYYHNHAQQSSKNETRFNGVYSRDNLPQIKNGEYEINLDEYHDIGTHWIALYVLNNDVTYFNSFRVEHIPKEIKAFIGI